MVDALPHPDLPKEAMSILPFESPESSLEKDAKLFIEEEDDLGETRKHRHDLQLNLNPYLLAYVMLS